MRIKAETGCVRLCGGAIARLRQAKPRDQNAIVRFFHGLSPDSRRHRFFSEGMPDPGFFASLCGGSGVFTLIVEADGRVIAAASLFPIDVDRAEVSFVVEEASRGQGLGSLLLRRLASIARAKGFTALWAVTDLENRPMLDVFRRSGLEIRERQVGGTIEIELSLPS